MQSILVKDYMSHNLLTLMPDMDILTAVDKLCKHGIPGAPVIDQFGNLVGILAEKDCLEVVLNASYYAELGGRVESVMHKSVETAESESNIADLAKRFLETGYRGMPVLEQNRLVGMIDRSDILRALINCTPY